MQTFFHMFFQGPGFYKPPSSFDNIPGGKIAFKNGPRLAQGSARGRVSGLSFQYGPGSGFKI